MRPSRVRTTARSRQGGWDAGLLKQVFQAPLLPLPHRAEPVPRLPGPGRKDAPRPQTSCNYSTVQRVFKERIVNFWGLLPTFPRFFSLKRGPVPRAGPSLPGRLPPRRVLQERASRRKTPPGGTGRPPRPAGRGRPRTQGAASSSPGGGAPNPGSPPPGDRPPGPAGPSSPRRPKGAIPPGPRGGGPSPAAGGSAPPGRSLSRERSSAARRTLSTNRGLSPSSTGNTCRRRRFLEKSPVRLVLSVTKGRFLSRQ